MTWIWIEIKITDCWKARLNCLKAERGATAGSILHVSKHINRPARGQVLPLGWRSSQRAGFAAIQRDERVLQNLTEKRNGSAIVCILEATGVKAGVSAHSGFAKALLK